MNWKVRFKNKTWVSTFVAFIVATVYQILAFFDIAPQITQDSIMQIIAVVLQALTLFGIIVDPTTAGLKDSNQALTYTEPKKSNEKELNNPIN